MKITKLEPIILHAPVTRGGIADSTHQLSHWGAPGVAIHTDTSHVGYGLNEAARWDSMAGYDKRDFNGTELRAFAGNFLYSTGANEFAKRYTLGHFDLPMRGCTLALDGDTVVDQGRLVA